MSFRRPPPPPPPTSGCISPYRKRFNFLWCGVSFGRQPPPPPPPTPFHPSPHLSGCVSPYRKCFNLECGVSSRRQPHLRVPQHQRLHGAPGGHEGAGDPHVRHQQPADPGLCLAPPVWHRHRGGHLGGLPDPGVPGAAGGGRLGLLPDTGHAHPGHAGQVRRRQGQLLQVRSTGVG